LYDRSVKRYPIFMKANLLVGIFLILSLSSQAQLGQWRLNNNPTDATTSGIHGSAVGSPLYSTDSREGTHSLVTDGSTQYIDLGNPSTFPSGTSARTISAWAKTNIATGSGVIFGYGSPSTTQAFYIGMNGTSLIGGSFGNSLTVTNFWTTGVWRHICMTYDGTTVRLYADGVEVSSASRAWGVVLSRAYIGRHVNNSNYWNGSIDDVRIYNTALSASQVAALATASPLPSSPTNFTATPVTATQINLNWTDNADNETGFQIHRSSTSATSGYSLIYTTAANATSYNNGGVTTGTQYYYRVIAVNANGSSAPAEASANTGSLLPTMPTGLTAVVISGSQINLSWTDNSSNETYFDLQRSQTSPTTGFATILNSLPNVTSFNDTGLTSGVTYYYRIRAANNDGNSGFAETSATASSQIPATPTALAATAINSSQINLSWVDNSSNESGFEIERAPSATGPFTLRSTTAANQNSFSDNNLSSLTTYYYRVRAVNASGSSVYTSNAIATTLGANGPVGLWRLNSNALDESGRNYNGTLINSPVYTASDTKEGSHALTLNGTQYVELGNPSGLPAGMSPRTISAWAKTTSTTGDHIIAAYGTNTTGQGMFIGQSGTSLFAGGWSDNIVINNFWEAGVWHHICLTYDGTTAKLYADGAEVSSSARTWNLALLRAYIGRHLSNTAYWNGTIDDVKIFDRALTQQEVHEAMTNTPAAQKTLNDYAFLYRYDKRKRMTAKKVPGADWVYMVYDERDRLVFTQDGNQRNNKDASNNPRPQWSYTKYDALNRPVMTGIYTHTDTLGAKRLQSWVSATNFSEARNNAQPHGYTNTVFSNSNFIQANFDVLTVTYYDDESFKPLILNAGGTTDTRFNFDGAQYTDQYKFGASAPYSGYPILRGIPVATKVKVLGDTKYLWTVNYYDDKFRLVQSIVSNAIGGIDRTTNVYDFVRLRKTKTAHNEGAPGAQTVERKFDFDDGGRLTKTWHNLNSAGWVLLARNEYNELGQVIDKKLHNTDPETTADASRVFKQSVDYRYNIRGWLKSMNDLGETEAGDLFGMNLNYNTPTANGGAAQFNGNISEIVWKSADGQSQSYAYTYDPMNRLVEGKYYNAANTAKNNRFNEKIWDVAQSKSGYDLNGNIRFLQREGKTGMTPAGVTTYGQMDNMSYSYTGNQLLRVTDAAVKTEGFLDGANTDDDYTYDVNGNMSVDKNKSITAATTANGSSKITYNHLNLVDKVVKSTGEYVKYIYDATGRKLSQIVYSASNVQQKRSDYAGEFFYEDNVLKFINHEEGRIIPGSPLEYQYHIKDHLGNVRVTFTTKLVTEAPVATLETANETLELSNFLRLTNARKVQYYAFDHTNGVAPTTTTGYAERLSGGTNERYGLARSISVMPGDKITAEVYAKYIDPVSGNRTSALNTFLGQVTSLIAAGTTSSGTVVDGGSFSSSTSSFQFPTQAANNTAGSTGAGPKAYLNWLVFDRDYNWISSKSGYKRISAIPKEIGQDVAHELLNSPDITIDVAGYVYIFLSNEEATPVDVYFDDFKVTQVKSPVVQMDDYYPFGLAFNSCQRENAVPNKHLYNNGSEKQDVLELNVYKTRFRFLDPAIGRWWQVDPKPDQELSPYGAMRLNPVRFNDPLGDTVKIDPKSSKQFVNDYHEARNKLREKGVSGRLTRLENSKTVYHIKEAKGRGGSEGSHYNSGTKTISWNSRLGILTSTGKILSPATVLNHEADHGARDDEDPEGLKNDKKITVEGYGNKEEQRVIEGVEQRTARELGEIGFDEVTRTDHTGTPFIMTGPTSTEISDDEIPTVFGMSPEKK
jgi:RHS repeat-associated protein